MQSYIPVEEYTDEGFEHAKEHFFGLMEDIYDTGSVGNLEFHMEEMADYFGFTIPRRDPVVEKKRTVQEKQTERMLQNWMGYTRAYAEMMANKMVNKKQT